MKKNPGDENNSSDYRQLIIETSKLKEEVRKSNCESPTPSISVSVSSESESFQFVKQEKPSSVFASFTDDIKLKSEPILRSAVTNGKNSSRSSDKNKHTLKFVERTSPVETNTFDYDVSLRQEKCGIKSLPSYVSASSSKDSNYFSDEKYNDRLAPSSENSGMNIGGPTFQPHEIPTLLYKSEKNEEEHLSDLFDSIFDGAFKNSIQGLSSFFSRKFPDTTQSTKTFDSRKPSTDYQTISEDLRKRDLPRSYNARKSGSESNSLPFIKESPADESKFSDYRHDLADQTLPSKDIRLKVASMSSPVRRKQSYYEEMLPEMLPLFEDIPLKMSASGSALDLKKSSTCTYNERYDKRRVQQKSSVAVGASNKDTNRDVSFESISIGLSSRSKIQNSSTNSIGRWLTDTPPFDSENSSPKVDKRDVLFPRNAKRTSSTPKIFAHDSSDADSARVSEPTW